MLKSSSDDPSATVLALTAGDPKGIGPEIIAKALANADLRKRYSPVVIGNQIIIADALSKWAPGVEAAPLERTDRYFRDDIVHILDPQHTSPGSFNIDLPEMEYIKAAVVGCQSKLFQAMVTAPICKESMYRRGFRFPGHTEYLSHLTNRRRPIMMFAAPGLKVSLATIHIPLSQVPHTLSTDLILETIATTDEGLKDFFRMNAPRLALCGLNPHAGEDGHLGQEEKDIIQPAVAIARDNGILIDGPLPADSVFSLAVEGKYDCVVALYHDQGLIPVKLLSFRRSVNLTLGIPIVRTSVDHGVAYEIAGKGVADPTSMESAIQLALEIVANRKAPFHQQK